MVPCRHIDHVVSEIRRWVSLDLLRIGIIIVEDQQMVRKLGSSLIVVLGDRGIQKPFEQDAPLRISYWLALANRAKWLL